MAKTPTRIYAVKYQQKTRLVRAVSPSQAIRHVVLGEGITAVSASADDVVDAMTAGAKVEEAGDAAETEQEAA